MTTVLAFGTFDLLHPGHEFFLSEARKLGDRLLVSMPADADVMYLKRKPPGHTFSVRSAAVKETGLVDDIFASDPPEAHGTFSLVERAAPDIIALGYDQQALGTALEEWKTRYQKSVELVTLPAYQPERYKTSLLRKSSPYDRS